MKKLKLSVPKAIVGRARVSPGEGGSGNFAANPLISLQTVGALHCPVCAWGDAR